VGGIQVEQTARSLEQNIKTDQQAPDVRAIVNLEQAIQRLCCALEEMKESTVSVAR
jgi:hypothetical protein